MSATFANGGDGRVVAIGEAMLRLTAPRGERLEGASSLQPFVAGAEANVARTLARLGVPTSWLSALPASPLGDRVIREIAADGVDTSHVERPDDTRLGLFFAEPGSPPRPTRVWYDRAESAFAQMEQLDAGALDGARFAVLSGITPALGERSRELAREFATLATREGARLCFDVNHRALLWSADAAQAGMAEFLGQADIVICAERDARMVFGVAASGVEACRALAERWAQRASIVVLTQGVRGSIMLCGTEVIEQPAVAAETVDAFGAGDAFLAGLLWGLWRNRSNAEALLAAATLASLKRSLLGDAAPLSEAELMAALGALPEGAIVR